MTLDDFLNLERLRGWSWQRNCVIWVADYIDIVTGIDVALPYRLRCRSEADVRRLIADEGGFMPMIGYRMDEAGFARRDPRRGDVGIVNAPLTQEAMRSMPVVGAVGGICIAPGTKECRPTFVVKTATGLRYMRLPVVTAWAVV